MEWGGRAPRGSGMGDIRVFWGLQSPGTGTLLCRTQGEDGDLLKPGARQELESHLGRGSVWRTPLTLHLLQVPIFPIVISPYWDFFSSKDKKFTSGK